MMSKPKYIFIFTGRFLYVVAGGTSHFYSFFSVNVLARVDVLVRQHWPLAWQAKHRPKTIKSLFQNHLASCLPGTHILQTLYI